jgi:hypothetical protein
MARGADGDKYFSESADAEITRRLCETAPCTRRLDAVSDGTAVSRPLPAQCGQFLGRTFWRGRKLTLNLTKRRAHTPSIKNRSNGPAYGAGALRLSRCRSKYTSAALNNIIHDE